MQLRKRDESRTNLTAFHDYPKGVDPVVLSSVMNTSTAKCWSSEINNPHPVVAKSMETQPPAAREYAGGFATNLMLKDLKLGKFHGIWLWS